VQTIGNAVIKIVAWKCISIEDFEIDAGVRYFFAALYPYHFHGPRDLALKKSLGKGLNMRTLRWTGSGTFSPPGTGITSPVHWSLVIGVIELKSFSILIMC
jgi:hypothetical protein